MAHGQLLGAQVFAVLGRADRGVCPHLVGVMIGDVQPGDSVDLWGVMAAAACGLPEWQLADRHVCVIQRSAIRLDLGGLDAGDSINPVAHARGA